MKKLHSLAFYALFTPAITLGSGALLAEEDSSGDRDVGEQSMGHEAEPEEQNTEQHEEATKSKYNKSEQTTDQKSGDQSGMQSKGDKESTPDDVEELDRD